MELEKADPFASVDAARNGEVFEGNLNAEHRDVFENDKINQGQESKHIHLPVAAKTDRQGFVFHCGIISNLFRFFMAVFYIALCRNSMRKDVSEKPECKMK